MKLKLLLILFIPFLISCSTQQQQQCPKQECPICEQPTLIEFNNQIINVKCDAYEAESGFPVKYYTTIEITKEDGFEHYNNGLLVFPRFNTILNLINITNPLYEESVKCYSLNDFKYRMYKGNTKLDNIWKYDNSCENVKECIVEVFKR